MVAIKSTRSWNGFSEYLTAGLSGNSWQCKLDLKLSVFKLTLEKEISACMETSVREAGSCDAKKAWGQQI